MVQNKNVYVLIYFINVAIVLPRSFSFEYICMSCLLKYLCVRIQVHALSPVFENYVHLQI